ncbi:hypothetical protein V5T12_09425 [Corynebacterium bovis]|uniref:hypothetical protein n=1 Tax=Corynebacterium bovis TaxID=36808 RepID=UPI00307FE8CB
MNQHPTPGSGRGGETPGGGPEDPTRHIPRVRGADSSAGGPGGPASPASASPGGSHAAPASAAGAAGGPGTPGGPDAPGAPDDAPTGDAAGADGGDRPTRRRRSGSDRNVTVLVAVAAVVALASAVTAGAAVTIAAQSHAHEQESRDRVAEIVAAMQEQTGRVAVPGTASSKGDPAKKAGATSSAAPAPSARGGGSASAGGGSASAGGGAAAGGAAAGGGAPAPQAPAEDGAPAPAEGDAPDAAAPAPADDAAPVDDGGAGEIPVPSAQELLDATMAASDANLSPEERTAWTVDGPVTSNTLSQVADVRAKAAPPPGQEAKGIGSPSFEMKDVVANGDTATATLVLVFPGEWGSWTYPGSTFRYIDGQWKLEKASVCNLAKMAWVSCY